MNLVIGGTGFLGGEIVRQLLKLGRPVRAFCRRRGDLPSEAELFLGDIKDLPSLLDACDGVETVYHTASWPNISVHWQPFYETNILGTRNVIDACLQRGVRRLIYTSSASVSFHCRSQEGVDESEPYPTRWLAHYPHSKAIAEKAVLDISRTENSEKPRLLTCSIRPHLIIGSQDRHLLPRLFDRARRERLFRVGDGTNLVDIIFVENAAWGHIQAADALLDRSSPVNGNAYFLSQGDPVNCWRWIDEVLSMKGLPAVKRSISFNTAWYMGACMELWYKLGRLQGEPLMTRFLAAQLGRTHYLNISKARKDFDFEPILTMQQGMDLLAKKF